MSKKTENAPVKDQSSTLMKNISFKSGADPLQVNNTKQPKSESFFGITSKPVGALFNTNPVVKTDTVPKLNIGKTISDPFSFGNLKKDNLTFGKPSGSLGGGMDIFGKKTIPETQGQPKTSTETSKAETLSSQTGLLQRNPTFGHTGPATTDFFSGMKTQGVPTTTATTTTVPGLSTNTATLQPTGSHLFNTTAGVNLLGKTTEGSTATQIGGKTLGADNVAAPKTIENVNRERFLNEKVSTVTKEWENTTKDIKLNIQKIGITINDNEKTIRANAETLEAIKSALLLVNEQYKEMDDTLNKIIDDQENVESKLDIIDKELDRFLNDNENIYITDEDNEDLYKQAQTVNENLKNYDHELEKLTYEINGEMGNKASGEGDIGRKLDTAFNESLNNYFESLGIIESKVLVIQGKLNNSMNSNRLY